MGMYVSHIQEILADASDRLKEVCPTVYPSRPAATQEQHSAFLVVSIPYGAEDETFIGTSYLIIEVYAKNLSGGVSNLPLLQELTNGVLDIFPISTDRYRAFRPRVLLKGDDGNGFAAWLIQAEMIIINV